MADDSAGICAMPWHGLQRVGTMPATVQWSCAARLSVSRVSASTAAANISSKHARISSEVIGIVRDLIEKVPKSGANDEHQLI